MHVYGAAGFVMYPEIRAGFLDVSLPLSLWVFAVGLLLLVARSELTTPVGHTTFPPLDEGGQFVVMVRPGPPAHLHSVYTVLLL